MRRRARQCPRWSCFAIDVQCQRLEAHEGPHGASPNRGWARHWSWTDADPNAIEVLPGTVWFEPPAPSRTAKVARFLGEWTAIVLAALVLWRCWSLTTAVVYLGLQMLLSVRRAHFLELGRWTAGVWPASPAAPRAIFALAWVWHGEGRNAKRAGLELVLGGVSVGCFMFLPRREWADFKRREAARQRARKGIKG